MASVNALQLETARRPASRTALFWPILYCACAHCYFAAFDQNSDIAIKFSVGDFLKERNNLAIRRRFHGVSLTPTFELERLY